MANDRYEVLATIYKHTVVEAIRGMILDNLNFDHRGWSIYDAETFERAARMIRDGYSDPGKKQ